MTAPDRAAAEQIVREVMREKYGRHDVVAEHVVTALDAAKLLRRPDEAAYVAELEAVADLVPKWLSEAADYPMTSEGLHAAAGVRLCAKELRAALDAVSAAETGSGEEPKVGDRVQWNGVPGYCEGTVESIDPDGAVFVRLDPNFALYVSPDKLRVSR